ncbi:hypothetical protein DACRYDRAFT_24192 [Dacryopinax primogenitus]|uniref:PDZ GRASP-type domain-containing protein n=1 Tax=Dacryopinax primogenitus (strain DJM 731) TaxID=1858805 RepID=M5FYD9_DACPD|nr:uncharacterized protein DACRYDRAFT_24192 [Dacryopinax primogenitus]EJT98566.1 hypothetical protein DACRYDRAFT_24192 [Dacryopinax primogenitus]
MGAGQSSSSQLPTALHVLRVSPGSPAALAHIEPFFDYIVGLVGAGVSDQSLEPDNLGRIVDQYEGRTLSLRVYSAKTKSSRLVSLTPSRVWALAQTSDGFDDPNAQPSLLGLSLRLCDPTHALENVWHILEVMEGSPAESAGLVPYGDWIVGWSGGVLGAESDFYDLVEAHVEKPLRVYVYSYDFDSMREVVLIPNRQWGGEGLLGCGVGYGLLHRIPQVEPHVDASSAGPTTFPAPQSRPSTTIYEEDERGDDTFVPGEVPWSPSSQVRATA